MKLQGLKRQNRRGCLKNMRQPLFIFGKCCLRSDLWWLCPVIGGLIPGLTCGAFVLSFALMHSSTGLILRRAQKKQKIKENPIAPRVFPGLRAAKANG